LSFFLTLPSSWSTVPYFETRKTVHIICN
jgi:hypothetical protein